MLESEYLPICQIYQFINLLIYQFINLSICQFVHLEKRKYLFQKFERKMLRDEPNQAATL